jgi:hypothetical protein
MVIRTEYISQRYSIGSSDPLPAGFEIRFKSLNFQATGNDCLMCITNRDELHPWRSTGPGPIPATPATDALARAQAAAASASTPRRHQCSGQHSRQAHMEWRQAVRAVARGDAPTGRDDDTHEGARSRRATVPLRDTQRYSDIRR